MLRQPLHLTPTHHQVYVNWEATHTLRI